NDENFEHHHRIKWRAPPLRPVRIGERRVQFRAKRLEFHRSLECLELVTEIAQPLQSIIDIEKSRLPSHRIISDPSVTMESERQRIGEVLRSIHLMDGPGLRCRAHLGFTFFFGTENLPAQVMMAGVLSCSWVYL